MVAAKSLSISSPRRRFKMMIMMGQDVRALLLIMAMAKAVGSEEVKEKHATPPFSRRPGTGWPQDDSREWRPK
jgi:hypothetical protein